MSMSRGPLGRRTLDTSDPQIAVLLAVSASVLLSVVLHRLLPDSALRTHNGLVIVVCAVFLLVAASLRWAHHQLTHQVEARTRAVLTAAVGSVVMPLHLWSHSGLGTGTTTSRQLALLGAARTSVGIIVVAVLLLALTRPRDSDRVLVLVAAGAGLAMTLGLPGLSQAWWPGSSTAPLRGLATVGASAWCGAAIFAWRRAPTHPWAADLVPSLLLVGATECLVAVDPQVPGVGATAAFLVFTVVSVAAALRARADLRAEVRNERRRTMQLEADLLRARDDLTALQQHERTVSHHARGTLAGLRAAMHIWATASPGSASDATVPPQGDGTADLRRAALVEIGSLDDVLREHRVELGRGPVALDLVVQRAVASARARGAEIVVQVPPLVVLGQITELETVLREVVDCSVARSSARRVTVTARPDGEVVRLTVAGQADHTDRSVWAEGRGPGRARVLETAEHLMTRQQGRLEHDARRATVRLELPTCPPPARRIPSGPRLGVQVPRQREPGAVHEALDTADA